MTRRDYLNATLIGSGAMLLRQSCPAQTVSAADWDGFGGTGDYRGANGNTFQVMAEGHRIRDHAFHLTPGSVTETGESYDCVVAGGGISGLAAALQFLRRSPPKATCLVIDDHAIFGGLAKRNEFVVDHQRVIANQASAMFFPPFPGTFLWDFYHSIGIDASQFAYQTWSGDKPEMAVGNTPYFDGGADSGFFFGRKFGQPHGRWVIDPWGTNLKDAPISETARQELLKTRGDAPDPLPARHGDALSRHLDSLTLEQHIIERYGVSRETIRTFLSPVAGGGSGIGADVLSAYADIAADVLLPWDTGKGVQMFPGGNAGVARHILKAMIPGALSGSPTMEGVCRGTVNFPALDADGARARVRLNSTIFSIRHEGDPEKSRSVRIVYSSQGKLFSVRAKTVVAASGSWTTKHIVGDLPQASRDAYAQFHRSPALVANIAVRNWRFLYRLGICQAQWFEGIGNYTAIRKLATFGPVAPSISPDSPVVLTLKILFSYPGMTLADQVKRGRSELLSTSYKAYEERLRDLLTDMFGMAGFDADKDIAGIVLNRWGHAYLSAQPGFFFGSPAAPAPGEILRKHPFGRIAFANSDLSGIMDHRASIQEASRAVDQCLAVMQSTG